MKSFDELAARLDHAKAEYQRAVDGLDRDLAAMLRTDAKVLRKAQHFQQQYAANPHTVKLAPAEHPGAEQAAPETGVWTVDGEPRGDQDPAPENS